MATGQILYPSTTVVPNSVWQQGAHQAPSSPPASPKAPTQRVPHRSGLAARGRRVCRRPVVVRQRACVRASCAARLRGGEGTAGQLLWGLRVGAACLLVRSGHALRCCFLPASLWYTKLCQRRCVVRACWAAKGDSNPNGGVDCVRPRLPPTRLALVRSPRRRFLSPRKMHTCN